MMKQKLPKRWKEENLGEIGKFKRGPFGGSLKKEIFVPSGYLVYEQYHPINNDFSFGRYFITKEKFEEMKAFVVKPGDLLISCSGTIGKIAEIQKYNFREGIINQALLKITLDEKKVDKKYFIYFFKSDYIQKYLLKVSRGVAIKNVPSVKELKQIKFPLPSLFIQKLIVQAIETQFSRLDDAIESMRLVKNRLGDYRKSVLKKAFEKGDDWEEVDLSELTKKITDGTHFTPRYIEKGVKFISVKDIRNDKIYFDNCKFISMEEHNNLIKRCHPEKGDLLITKSGTIGRTAVVNTDEEFSLFVSVALIKSIKNVLDSKFLMYFFQKYINSINISNDIKGTAIKNFHLEDMRKLKIPKLSIKEQQKIIFEIESEFSIIDNVEKTVIESLTKSEQLRKSILKKAFEGKLIKPMEIKN